MNLIPRHETRLEDPFAELLDLRNELFDLPFGPWSGRGPGLLGDAWAPAIDVHESKDDIVVKADLPGFRKEDLNVSIEDGTLVIQGEKKEENERKGGKGAVRTERFYGAFRREIALPASVEEGRVKAVCRDGVLELRLPKREEAKPKTVRIDVA